MVSGEKRVTEQAKGWVQTYAPAIACAIFVVYLALTSPLTSRWVDFPVYWEAGKKALVGATVYDVPGHFQYKYSPFIAFVFGALFSGASFAIASWIFQKVMLAIWIFIFWKAARGRSVFLFPLFIIFGNALRLDLQLGQLNALVFALMLFLFEASKIEGRWRDDLVFGIVFSIAVQLKLFAFILVPVLILRKSFRKLAWGLFLLPAISLIGVALPTGWEFSYAENLAWLRSLTASTDELLLNEQNVGLLGFFGKVFGLGIGKAIWFLAGITFMAWLYRERKKPLLGLRNRTLAAIAVFNPLVWSYWVLFFIPLFGEIARNPVARKRLRSPVGIGASVFIFAAFVSQHARWAWQGGIFFALALVFGFALLTPLASDESP